MSAFFGNHENRLDAKGRVSVPAGFRAALRGDTEAVSLVLRPSHIPGCVEAWPRAAYDGWQRKLDALDHFDPQRAALATLLYGDAQLVESDAQGRILIPGELAALAGLKDAVNFSGQGDHFQIWEPQAGAAFRAAARALLPEFSLKARSA